MGRARLPGIAPRRHREVASVQRLEPGGAPAPPGIAGGRARTARVSLRLVGARSVASVLDADHGCWTVRWPLRVERALTAPWWAKRGTQWVRTERLHLDEGNPGVWPPWTGAGGDDMSLGPVQRIPFSSRIQRFLLYVWWPGGWMPVVARTGRVERANWGRERNRHCHPRYHSCKRRASAPGTRLVALRILSRALLCTTLVCPNSSALLGAAQTQNLTTHGRGPRRVPAGDASLRCRGALHPSATQRLSPLPSRFNSPAARPLQGGRPYTHRGASVAPRRARWGGPEGRRRRAKWYRRPVRPPPSPTSRTRRRHHHKNAVAYLAAIAACASTPRGHRLARPTTGV